MFSEEFALMTATATNTLKVVTNGICLLKHDKSSKVVWNIKIVPSIWNESRIKMGQLPIEILPSIHRRFQQNIPNKYLTKLYKVFSDSFAWFKRLNYRFNRIQGKVPRVTVKRVHGAKFRLSEKSDAWKILSQAFQKDLLATFITGSLWMTC